MQQLKSNFFSDVSKCSSQNFQGTSLLFAFFFYRLILFILVGIYSSYLKVDMPSDSIFKYINDFYNTYNERDKCVVVFFFLRVGGVWVHIRKMLCYRASSVPIMCAYEIFVLSTMAIDLVRFVYKTKYGCRM